MKEINMLSSVTYHKVDDAGLHISVGDDHRVLDVDHVVVCAGQESLRELMAPLQAAGASVHLIGGAEKAVQLDAKRAIDQGARLSARL
jgi:2,4-dienoyl-CoA reductase (NADPH2)